MKPLLSPDRANKYKLLCCLLLLANALFAAASRHIAPPAPPQTSHWKNQGLPLYRASPQPPEARSGKPLAENFRIVHYTK